MVREGRSTASRLSEPTPVEASEERSHQRIVLSHQLSAPRDITRAMRTQFNGTKDGTETTTGELDVQVQIEQAVMVDYNLNYGQENCRKPRAIWDRKQSTIKGEEERPPAREQGQWELSSMKSVTRSTDTV